MTENIYESLKQFKTVVEERDRLREVVKSFHAYAHELNTMAGRMEVIAKQLDPYIKSQNRTGTDYQELAAQLYDKVKSGTEVGTGVVATMFSITEQEARYVLTKLRTMAGIQERKEGLHKYYYYG